VAYGGHLYLVCAVCDVTIWRRIHVSKATLWRSWSTQYAYSSTPGFLNSDCSEGQMKTYKVTRGRITTLTQQWRYLNHCRNSFYILCPAKGIVSYRQIISSRPYVRLKRTWSLPSRALLKHCSVAWWFATYSVECVVAIVESSKSSGDALLLLRPGSWVRPSIQVAQGDAALWLQQMAPNVLVTGIPRWRSSWACERGK